VGENTRRQITWLILGGILIILVIVSIYRHTAVSRALTKLEQGTPAERVAAVNDLIAANKLADVLTDQPRWVQDKAVTAVATVGTPEALLQLIEIIPVVDKPVAEQASAYLVIMGDQAIGPLVQKLRDKDAAIRAAATGPLINIGAPVIPSVIKLVDAYDDYVRDAAVAVLGSIGLPAAPPLVKLAQHTEPWGQQTAAAFIRGQDTVDRALAAMKVPALAPVIDELLVYEKPEVRARAAVILGQIIDQTSESVRGVQTIIPIPMADAQQAVPPLIARLNTDRHWGVRREAARALGRLRGAGDQPLVLDALLAHLNDPQPEAKAGAVEALGLIGQPAVAPALVNTLVTNRQGAEQELAVTLERLGPSAIPALPPALNSADSQVRRIATQILAQIGTPQAAPLLAERLADSDTTIRRTAAEALIPIAIPQVAPQLVVALGDPDWKVYNAAGKALAELGAPAVPALIARLGVGDPRINYVAQQTLASIGKPAIPALVNGLYSSQQSVRTWSAVTLGEIGPITVELVSRILADPAASPATRAAAARALGYSGADTAVEPLVKAARATQQQIRIAALQAINYLRHPDGTEALVKGLTDSSPAVRDTAMRILKQWRLGDSEEALAEVLQQDDENAQRRAAIVLAHYRSPAASVLISAAPGESPEAAAEATKIQETLRTTVEDTQEASHLRREAIKGLGYVGTGESVSVLESLLTPQAQYSAEAATAIAQIGRRQYQTMSKTARRLTEAGQVLLKVFRETDSDKLRLDVAVALAQMRYQPVPTLITGFTSWDESLRPWIAAVLAGIGEPATQDLMGIRSETKDADNKAWCTAALLLIGNAEVLRHLGFLPEEEQLADDDERLVAARQVMDRIMALSPG